jgi:hypothetical protein
VSPAILVGLFRHGNEAKVPYTGRGDLYFGDSDGPSCFPADWRVATLLFPISWLSGIHILMNRGFLGRSRGFSGFGVSQKASVVGKNP